MHASVGRSRQRERARGREKRRKRRALPLSVCMIPCMLRAKICIRLAGNCRCHTVTYISEMI